MIAAVLRSLMLTGVLATVLVVTGCMRGSARTPASGAELYGSCVACHGANGEGTASLGAPAIAGLPAWYVSSQVTRFQHGLRGKHPDDVEGLKMRSMSKQMMSDAEVTAVAAHIAGLPRVRSAATITSGDPAIGQQAFTLCVACHGMNGEGNQAVNAPPLAGLDDWYVAAQLRKFRSGIRGTVTGDSIGPIMQAMSMTIAPENVNHLAAYVHTLPQK